MDAALKQVAVTGVGHWRGEGVGPGGSRALKEMTPMAHP